MMGHQIPNQAGRIFLVTGANSGLGFETAKAVAGAGGHVVLAVRDTTRGESAARRIDGSTEVRRLDLADLKSVESFAKDFDQPLDVLVNNAGIMMVPEGRTKNGFERHLGTNHLGHFALTNLLLPRITDRVVTVSSNLHRGPQIDFSDINLEKNYSPTRAYQQSKLANLLFTSELQRRLSAARSPIRAVACHPGYAATNLQSHHASPVMRRVLWLSNKVVAVSAARGAESVLYAATADVPAESYIGPTGRTMRGDPGVVERSTEAEDHAAARTLWDVSERLTGVTWPFSAGRDGRADGGRL